jgi:hypothetical protein
MSSCPPSASTPSNQALCQGAIKPANACSNAAERLRRGDCYCCRLGLRLSWIGDRGGFWDEISFHETRNTSFLLACLGKLRRQVPRYKPLSVGVVLRGLDVMRWGLVPFWAKDIKVGFANINAKAEGIETKPAFREAFRQRRCLVPVERSRNLL